MILITFPFYWVGKRITYFWSVVFDVFGIMCFSVRLWGTQEVCIRPYEHGIAVNFSMFKVAWFLRLISFLYPWDYNAIAAFVS